MKINILMSTYNGEDFLAQQIQSIQDQTVQDWKLLIRDDGSVDKTQEIIADFVQRDGRIEWINEKDSTNLGVVKSFQSLVQHEEADFYFFSDQDDVWLPDKLELSLAEAKKYPAEMPLMVYMDLKVVNQDLEVMVESMIRTQSHHANTELVQELTENTVTGGVAMINHALAQLWNTADDLLMHDWYLALMATAFGKLVYIDQPGELYRQHDNNVLGARTNDKRFKLFREGPRKIFTRYWDLIHKSQDQAKHLLQYKDRLDSQQIDLIENFIRIDQEPFLKRLYLLMRYKYSKNKLMHTLVFKMLILTNIYNKRNE